MAPVARRDRSLEATAAQDVLDAKGDQGRVFAIVVERVAAGDALDDEAARLVIERIASSDALYHDCEHTALVTLCVQDILRGRRLERTITPSDWGHAIWAALNHDIGYVRGICPGDTADKFVIDAAGNTVTPPRGASDAFLMPYHVERSKMFVRQRFAPVPFIDEGRIADAIELTRFPVPDDDD